MRDERFSDFLDEVNAKQHQTRLAHVLPVVGLVIAFVPAFAFGPEFLLLLLMGAGGGYVLGRWLDSYRRVSVLYFEMDQHAAARYEALTRAFDQMAKCAGKWHIAAGGQVQDLATWKRNAGATTLLSRSLTTLHYALPEVIKSNVTPPAIGVGRQTIYLMPDLLLVLDGVRFGAVAYEALGLEWQISNFIEEEAVPGDTQVLRYTWRHPNKSGGPDRRFANNYQIPVCEYEVLHLASENGLNELLQFSRAGVSAPFAEAVHQLDYASQQYVGTALLTGE